MVGGEHEDGSLPVADLVEDTPFTDAIAPGGGLLFFEAIESPGTPEVGSQERSHGGM
jgi:hypothetical protein